MKQGKVSENIIKRSVLKCIENEMVGAAVGTDCAIFTGYIANEVDIKCVTHAIIRACNNAAVAGYNPESVSLSITMPETMREIKLKNMMQEAASYAKATGIIIADGHSETVEGIKCPIITATVLARKSEWIPGKLAAGQAIIMTKWMAMSGGARIAKERKDELLTKYPYFIVEDAANLEQFYSILPEAAVAVRSGAISMNDCSDGGVFAALWQLADKDGVGLEVNLRDIPVRQETIEVCEYFDINPYKLRSDGSLLIVTEDPEAMIEKLHAENIPATCIGHITDGLDRVIISGEDRRFLEEPRQDEGVMI